MPGVNPETGVAEEIHTSSSATTSIIDSPQLLPDETDRSLNEQNRDDVERISLASEQTSIFSRPTTDVPEVPANIEAGLSRIHEDVQRTQELAIAQRNITPVRPVSEPPIIIQLKSRHFMWNWPAWIYTFLVLLNVLFVSLYWLEALPAGKFGSLLFNDPSNTIFTVSILSAATVILLDRLTVVVRDSLRWSLATREGGIALTDFAALSNITPFGLFLLLVMPGKSSKGDSHMHKLRNSSFRFWSTFRYMNLLLL